MLEYMKLGGHIMWVIAALSVLALAVCIERAVFFCRASADPEKLEAEFSRALSSGGEEAALWVSASGDSSMHRLFRAALSHWNLGREEMRLLVEQEIRKEIYRWEKNVFVLELVGKLAPLLGLLGTVLGEVEMFRSLHLSSGISETAVTGGLWTALFTTVAGLVVAIPAIFMHGLFMSRIDSVEEMLERGGDYLLRRHFGREHETR